MNSEDLTGRAFALGERLYHELGLSLAADDSLPGILATVLAPRLGLDWSGAVDRRTGLAASDAFRIASVTKIHTAAAVHRLIEQGRIGLFARVAPWLSSDVRALFADAGYQVSSITFYQLLTHTAGLHDHAAAEHYTAAVVAQPGRVWTAFEQIALSVSLGPALASPGTRFSYSDTGYVLLGEIVAAVTRQPLAAAVRDLLGFERLGLDQTWWEGAEAAPPGQRRATQLFGSTDVSDFHASVDQFGGGGLVSTTGDLVRFLRALLRGELFETPGTLAAALMTHTVACDPDQFLHSALLRGRPFAGRQAWCHGGFWGVQLACFADLDITFAVSWNQVQAAPRTTGAPGQAGLADRIAAILLEHIA